MEQRYVRPAVGPDGERLVTRNPATGKPLSADGEWVDYDGTTRRRLRDKDWEEAPAPQAAAELERESLESKESP